MDNIQFIAGGIAGAGLALSGHPMDTLKTWTQANTFPSRVTFRSLYRGVAYPFAGQIILNSSLFGLQDFFNTHVTNGNRVVGGVLAGSTSCILTNPMELYKIRAQEKLPFIYNPFRGFSLTLLRESTSFGIYFGTYYYLKDNYCDENRLGQFVSGGLAGVFSWMFNYPVDVVKTRVQSDMSYKEAIKMGNLSAGFKWCMLRAFICNSIAFLLYESSVNFITDKKGKNIY